MGNGRDAKLILYVCLTVTNVKNILENVGNHEFNESEEFTVLSISESKICISVCLLFRQMV